MGQTQTAAAAGEIDVGGDLAVIRRDAVHRKGSLG
jgi:hypothetical protein